MSDDLTDLYGTTDTGSSKKPNKVTARSRKVKTTERVEQTRGRRRSINDPQLKLAVTHQIPGYHLCWTNDEDNRIEYALDAGYEFASKKEIGLSESTPVPANNDVGDKVRRYVGTDKQNNPLYAYLLKIPEDWHKEDLMVPHKRSQDILRAIQKGKVAPDAEGNSNSANTYVPDGGIQMSDSLAVRER